MDDANRPKRVRAEQGAYATSDNNHCEGCGIPRHRRDQCQLSDHPDWNSRGLWTERSAFSAIKKKQEASGEQDKHPKLKWSEYTKGGTIPNARFPDKNRVDRSGDKAATLFDTGVHASFVNREVASWIEEHGGTDRQVPDRKRGWQEANSTTVSLAGTSDIRSCRL